MTHHPHLPSSTSAHSGAHAILYRALDLPSGDRQQFIAQASAGDTGLLEDVRTMLSRIEQLDQFLEDPLELPAEQKAPVVVLPRHGDLIGDWKVERELGRNGADLILLVRRHDDGRFGSMRLAQSATRGGQTVTRFERLRERLATLDHPAIFRPADSGVSADGRPYFVVERGDGAPIDQYCASHRLDLAARAMLFARVCDAVHFMHQHLIVHRDLKPADMLVDDDGELTLLEVGMIGDGWPLHPAYASPEQLAGKPLSLSADVYALGAVLYTLLTGRYAHGVDASGVFKTAGRDAVLAPSLAVASSEAGTQASADLPDDPVLLPSEALVAQLREHFDAIVIKALTPDPAGRYASADALARDLERAAIAMRAAPGEVAEPVDIEEAGPPEVAATPAAALIAPSAEPVTAPVLPPAAPAPARRTPVALAIAMLVAGFVAGVLAAPLLHSVKSEKPASPAISAGMPAPVLAPAVMPAAGGTAPLAATSAAPMSFAAALALADSRHVAGDLAAAQAAAQQAVSLLPSVPQSERDQAGADANLRLGAILAEQGQTAEGLALLRKALALHESHAAMENGAQSQRAAADVHRAIAAVLAGSGDDAGAETELAAARTVYAAQLSVTPADASLHNGLLDIEMAQATSQNAQKHGRDTVTTLAALRRLAGSHGDARIDLLEAYVQPRGTPERAYAAARPALAKLRQLNGDPDDVRQQRMLARALMMTGEIGVRARQNKAACGQFEEAGKLLDAMSAAGRLNAYDKLALQRLGQMQQACK